VDIDIPAQDIPMEEGETFATGGRVGMAGGGILKLAMKFFMIMTLCLHIKNI
jgi:hypothetical protein